MDWWAGLVGWVGGDQSHSKQVPCTAWKVYEMWGCEVMGKVISHFSLRCLGHSSSHSPWSP